MSKQDIKAGGAFVELAVKDVGFQEKFAKAKDMLLSFAAASVSVGAVMKVAKMAIDAATAPLKEFTAAGTELARMAQRTGANVEALSELKFAAEKTGVAFSSVEDALKHMRSLRVDPEQFDDMAAAVASIEDPILRAQAATRAFGSAGEALLPMLDNLEGARQQARDLGLVMSGESATAAYRLGDAFRSLWETLKAGLAAIGEVLGAMITPLMGPVQAAASFALTQFKTMTSGIYEAVASVTDFIGNAWAAMHAYVAPIIGANVAMYVDGFNMVRDTVQAAFEYIQAAVSSAWEVVSSVTGSALQYFQDTVIGVLEAVSFAWQNWRTLLETAVVSGELAVVRFANQVVYFFSELIPGWLSWFGENWSDVFTDVASLTATIAGNIWENLKNLWDAIKGLFSGDGFNFEWTGLTEGFESAIKEWPKIAEREMGPLEKSLQTELDGLATNLTSEWEKHGKEFAASVSKYTPKDEIGDLVRKATADAKASGDRLTGATPNAKAMQSNVSGTFNAAAAMAMGQGGNNDPTTKAIEKSSRERKEEAAKLLEAVKVRNRIGP